MALGLPLAQLSTELSVEALQLWVEVLLSSVEALQLWAEALLSSVEALQLWVEVLLSSVQEYEYLSEMEYSLEVWEYWSEARALEWMLPSGDGCLLT